MFLGFSDPVTSLFAFEFTPNHSVCKCKCLIKIDDQIRYANNFFCNKSYLSILAWPRSIRVVTCIYLLVTFVISKFN